MTIQSIRLISNTLRPGVVQFPTKEVEQRLTISSSGRVWFSAVSFQQYKSGKGFCRKEQMHIGKWKAEFLLELIERMQAKTAKKAGGTYELTIRYGDGTYCTNTGSLCEDSVSFSYGGMEVCLDRILHRYIPIEALWGFDYCRTQDYDGKYEIHAFAETWYQVFSSEEVSGRRFGNAFGDKCCRLGFRMDCGKEFIRMYPECFDMYSKKIETVIDSIEDIDLLGSAVYSQWRYITYWTQGPVDEETCRWFALVLGQMKKLTE